MSFHLYKFYRESVPRSWIYCRFSRWSSYRKVLGRIYGWYKSHLASFPSCPVAEASTTFSSSALAESSGYRPVAYVSQAEATQKQQQKEREQWVRQSWTPSGNRTKCRLTKHGETKRCVTKQKCCLATVVYYALFPPWFCVHLRVMTAGLGTK